MSEQEMISPDDQDVIDMVNIPDLKEKEEIFCQHYAVYGSGIQAYKKGDPNVMTNTAAVGACNLMKRADIRLRINQIRTARMRKLSISGDKILMEIAKIAFYDKNMTYGPTGERLRECDTDPDTVNALRPKATDKIKALELLGKHQRLFIDRVEQDGTLTVEVVKFSGTDPSGKIALRHPSGTNDDPQAHRMVNGVRRTHAIEDKTSE